MNKIAQNTVYLSTQSIPSLVYIDPIASIFIQNMS